MFVCRATTSVCRFLDSISDGNVLVKISSEDLKFISEHLGWTNARALCTKKNPPKKNPNINSIRVAENKSVQEIFRI
jgi:hypothetical protein